MVNVYVVNTIILVSLYYAGVDEIMKLYYFRFSDYSSRRYGQNNKHMDKVWQLLKVSTSFKKLTEE